MPNEDSLKAAIVKMLTKRGIFSWRNPVGPFSRAGLPDILGCLPGGRFLGVEAKAPGRYKDPTTGLTPAQVHVLDMLNRSGALAICVDSVEAVELALDHYLEASP